ncbi:MAG: zf-HC2 domain-containing protein [Thermoanaerobaculia bacterium]|nr:zf-HC2 domain-containing protein [Thermoanaerobaculia bacterium]MCZ7651457.1 zf-HC2 domain-containing protein [Thermoanaerobaculia bacterium]
MDCSTYREWTDLDLEGELPAPEAQELAAHLEGCAGCRRVREEGSALLSRLAGDRLEVRPGFRAAVLQALPAAGWEAQHPRAWLLPLLALAAVGGAAAALFGVSAARLGAGAPLPGAALALADLLVSSLLAGSGLAAASWRGLGEALGELLSTSPSRLVAVGVLFLALNWGLFRLVRRPAAARGASASRDISRRAAS